MGGRGVAAVGVGGSLQGVGWVGFVGGGEWGHVTSGSIFFLPTET